MISQMSPSQQEGGRKKLGDSVRLITDDKSAMTLTVILAVLIRILELMHEALCDNVIISKRCAPVTLNPPIVNLDQNWIGISLIFQCRNIYYKDPALFKTQVTVDYYVDIIANTFGVSRLALNVVSSCPCLCHDYFWLTRHLPDCSCERPCRREIHLEEGGRHENLEEA